MKKLILPLFLILSSNSLASNYDDIIISNLWKNIGHQSKVKLAPTPTPKPEIRPEVKPTPEKNPSPLIAKKEEKKAPKLSPGQLKIAEMKRKNRERLKQIKNKKKSTAKNEARAKENPSIYDLARNANESRRRQVQNTLTSWKKQERATLKKWSEARDKFLSNIKHYRAATFELESSFGKYSSKKWEKNLQLPPSSNYHIIPSALSFPIRDQGKRPTCSAFAGTRAIEIALAQKGKQIDLSEQYVYWSSKPYCQQSPCSKRGSWITYALDHSKSASSADIPSESSCPYTSLSRPGNETQIPMSSSCQRGIVKIERYDKLNSNRELIRALDNNQSIVGGFKLSPNFYKTRGIISYQDSLVNGKMDQHASGHALLIVGYMKLPKKLTRSHEGSLCYIVANSWTEGWGTGGYGCITEKWLRKYRVNNPFIAITGIRSQ
ncbi:hypothetical protein A9Q84_09910 [Halobacteriovorax marinus]|uniref:Peptidase C1A papain C-terminal domain-containing protein n=1 Tax=Halobacteriovorax marinus TaxID=97084 RepID=A0A1Y5FCI5_9BACT|nr:hypothetical protein A9Q84_09910 [Halobacteriovorax marinus]